MRLDNVYRNGLSDNLTTVFLAFPNIVVAFLTVSSTPLYVIGTSPNDSENLNDAGSEYDVVSANVLTFRCPSSSNMPYAPINIQTYCNKSR